MIGVTQGLTVGCQGIEIVGRVFHAKREALGRSNRKVPAPGALSVCDLIHGIGQKRRIENPSIQNVQGYSDLAFAGTHGV